MKKISKFVLTALLLLLMVGCTEGGEITVDDLGVDNDVVETVEVDATTNEESYLEQIRAYDSEIALIMDNSSYVTGNIVGILEIVSENQSVPQDSPREFSDALNSNFDALEVILEEIKNLDVPKGYENVNALFTESFEYFASARFNMFNGFLQADTVKIRLGTESFDNGNVVLLEAINEYVALNEANGYVR